MSDNLLIKNLLNSQAYAHPIKQFKVLETHISWVILTGDYAYKIKKPVNFGFLDYSTLEKRKFYCDEEARLNQLLAPELDIQVITINGSITNPCISGEGEILEYAVKMKEFTQDCLFTEVLKRKELTPKLIDQLATIIATFHEKTPIAPANSIYGTPEHVHAPVEQNFEQIEPLLTDPEEKAQLIRLQEWSNNEFNRYKSLFQKRKVEGFIRECHGDLHLGNIILFKNRPLVFDRIEFNDDLRWTDVIADIAFLAMSLEHNQESSLAKRLLNLYFSLTSDYEGLALLPYYQAYRAIVRAKISLFSITPTSSEAEREALKQAYRNFINLAEHYTQQIQPMLMITCGVTGSGKSTLAQALVEKMGAYQVRSDIERKRLYGLLASANTQSAVNQGIYDEKTNEKTYARLASLAQLILKAGYSVIVDAAFLKKDQRGLFQQLARELVTPFIILYCEAAHAELTTRLTQRKAMGTDPSEGRLEVLLMQEQTQEPLTVEEKNKVLIINSENFEPEEIIMRINNINVSRDKE